MNSAAWALVDEAIAELESNSDLELQTARRYVTGFLIQRLSEEGLLPPAIPQDVPNAEQRRYKWLLTYEPAPRTPRVARRKMAGAKPKASQ